MREPGAADSRSLSRFLRGPRRRPVPAPPPPPPIASRGAATTGCVAWLALLLAVLALALAAAAYRRTGGKVDDWLHHSGDQLQDVLERPLGRGQDAPGDSGVGTDLRRAVERAVARLQAERQAVAAERDPGGVRREVEKVRADLERAFSGAGGGERSRWQGLDAELGRLDQDLRAGGSRALGTLDGLVDNLRGVLRPSP
jgi:hypothetical protein